MKSAPLHLTISLINVLHIIDHVTPSPPPPSLRYHYYGLSIKETSIYYRSVYSKKGLTRYAYNCNQMATVVKLMAQTSGFSVVADIALEENYIWKTVNVYIAVSANICERTISIVTRNAKSIINLRWWFMVVLFELQRSLQFMTRDILGMSK